MKLQSIDCVILCGGLGTRLRSEIGQKQKVMSDLNGRPFLDILLTHLIKEECKRVILCIGYQADDIENYFKNQEYDLTIELSKEDQPLGTGGALKNARSKVQSDPFLVLNGDSYCPANLGDFLDDHKNKNAKASIVLTEAEDRLDFGTVVLGDGDKVSTFKEKVEEGGSSLINAGIYGFNKDIFGDMPQEDKFSLEKDFFPKLINSNFYGHVVKEKLIDIGTPERYSKAKEILK